MLMRCRKSQLNYIETYEEDYELLKHPNKDRDIQLIISSNNQNKLINRLIILIHCNGIDVRNI